MDNFEKSYVSFMLRNNNLHWRQYLQQACNIKNSKCNSTIKQFPNKLWKAGHPNNINNNVGNVFVNELQRISAKS